MVIRDISGSDNGKSPPTQPKGKNRSILEEEKQKITLLHEILVTF